MEIQPWLAAFGLRVTADLLPPEFPQRSNEFESAGIELVGGETRETDDGRIRQTGSDGGRIPPPQRHRRGYAQTEHLVGEEMAGQGLQLVADIAGRPVEKRPLWNERKTQPGAGQTPVPDQSR